MGTDPPDWPQRTRRGEWRPFWTEVDGPYQRDEDRQEDLFASIILDKRTSPLK